MLLGLDVGGTKCACVIGDGEGRVIDRSQWPSDAEAGPEPMIRRLIDEAVALRDKHVPGAVGVSIGGPLDARRGVVLSPPNLPGWDAVPLRDRLGEALRLPVRVEHDAAACALAEFRWGLGRSLPAEATLVYLTCGSGFGMGLVVAGRLYRGAGGRSPEIGHVRLHDDGPMGFGKAGSVEAYCAGNSLPRLATWMYPQRWQADPPDGPALVRLAEAGDDDARQVLLASAAATGRVAAAVADSLFPDAIVLGSLARHLPTWWLDKVRETFAAEALPDAQQLCRLEPAVLGDRLQDCSALAAALG